MKFKNLLFGKPLKNDQKEHELLSVLWGLPIMASDAISSVAYAVEEILLVLIPVVGIIGTSYVSFISIPIILLLLLLIISYKQIINHYPNGGGSYIVAQENFGKKLSLLAASCLIIDYIMTVAVSISSSSAALSSALPSFYKFNILISILSVLFITIINLRGTNESSKIFGIPTYIFIISMGIMIVTGFIKFLLGSLEPIVYTQNQLNNIIQNQVISATSLFLFMRAFSAGSSALTGVEAVSNAIPSFKKPKQKTAGRILVILGLIIIFIFLGTSILASFLKVIPLNEITVVSQIANAIFGHSLMFYIIQFSTSIILLLAANTAYNGLPILLSILAKDNYMPKQFNQIGAKLTFSNGIIFIFLTSSLLLIIFKADTHKLIPFYSVGVFISFTIAQAGMFLKIIKSKEKNYLIKSSINFIGAITTFICTIIVFTSKFIEGAWMLLIIIPLLIYFMKSSFKHYDMFTKSLEIKDFKLHKSNELRSNSNYVVLINHLNKATLKTLNYALSVSNNVSVVHIATSFEEVGDLKKSWHDLNIKIPFTIIYTPYRDIIDPLEKYLKQYENNIKHGESITVVLTKYQGKGIYDTLFHNQTTLFLENRLLKHKNIVTVIIPYIYD